jgi:hypothetical protein
LPAGERSRRLAAAQAGTPALDAPAASVEPGWVADFDRARGLDSVRRFF